MIEIKLPPLPPISYPIFIGNDLLRHPEAWLSPSFLQYQCYLIISDNTVSALYASRLQEAMRKLAISPELITFPPGEASKSLATYQELLNQLLAQRAGRNTLLLALGGGVTGDLTGFVAATYLRGIDYLQLPTTLLAMVDSSIGGKTAINHPLGKNLIGAFHHPQSVIIDLKTLTTLPERELLAGMMEIAKIFLTSDRKSFFALNQLLTTQKLSPLLSEQQKFTTLIERAIMLKSEIVETDPKEKTGQRSICNFGHTVAHALEKVTNYQLLHGIAVGIGLLIESHLSYQQGILAKEEYQLISNFLKHVGILEELQKLIRIYQITPEEVAAAMRYDKKNEAVFSPQPRATSHQPSSPPKKDFPQEASFILLKRIGEIEKNSQKYTHPFDLQEIKEIIFIFIEKIKLC